MTYDTILIKWRRLFANIANTRIFIIPWHITKNRYSWMAQRIVACHIPIERETVHVCIYRWCLVTSVTARDAGWVKMATNAEKAYWVPEYGRTQSIVTVQRRFWTEFGKDPPVKNSIKQWYEKFQPDGCLCIAKRPGRQDPSEERVKRVRETFQRSPRKSTNRATLRAGHPATHRVANSS
jgi:hypothetical protein